jgi:hypothetical protein
MDIRAFKPKDLLEVVEDDEDRYFLKEFELEADEKPKGSLYSAEHQRR